MSFTSSFLLSKELTYLYAAKATTKRIIEITTRVMIFLFLSGGLFSSVLSILKEFKSAFLVSTLFPFSKYTVKLRMGRQNINETWIKIKFLVIKS